MRKLRRPTVNLPTLTGDGKGARTAAEYAKVWEANADAHFDDDDFPPHWTEADVRGALLAFHGRVCAYCQCELPHNNTGDVEHFRPKSTYWWLAYNFTNYFLSCSTCNSGCKGTKFPLPHGTVPWAYADKDRIEEEKHLLLNPAVDDVEDWVRTDLRDPIFSTIPAPELDNSSEAYIRTQTTIEFFKLNGYPLRMRRRIATVRRALKLLASNDPGDIEEIRKMASRFQPYGWIVRQLLAAANAGDTIIPSLEKELQMFVQDLLEELALAERVLHKSPKHQPTRRLQEQILWALAVLWKFPPEEISPDFVELLLVESGCRDKVEKYYAQI